MVQHRFLLIIYPSRSHFNPALQFAKRLIAMDVHVTLAITLHIHRLMPTTPTIPGLSIVTFSDGYDHGLSVTSDDDYYNLYTSELKRRGSEFLTNLIVSRKTQAEPFTCLTYTMLSSWAHEVARKFEVPTALLWIEPATVFSIVHYYFHGHDEYINCKIKEEPSSCSIAIPGLPLLLSPCDIPSFLTASVSKAMSFPFQLFKEQFEELDKETNPIVLANTFEALEPDALRGAIHGIKMIPIGPLLPSTFLDGKDAADNNLSGSDIFKASNDDYIEWLDSKEESSVVYVSFGSYFELSKRQEEEIARALKEYGRPFLWVVREKSHHEVNGKTEEVCYRRKESESMGKIVKWCSQVEVLSHASLGCFLSHCGWNSTMESLVSGVPVVAFPQWVEQRTNAKLIEDLWKTGVRVDHMVNDEGIVKAEDIKKCLDAVMGSDEKGKELRMNAKKWKTLAKQASMEGGHSKTNLEAFVNLFLK